MERLEPEEEPAPVAREELDAFLRRGIAEFNRAEYHAAHETFERIWVSGEDAETDFFKGLIQAAICLHHYQRDNPDGARKLYRGHRTLLAGYLPEHRGVDVAGFLAAMQTFLRPVARPRGGEEPRFDPESRPRIVVRDA